MHSSTHRGLRALAVTLISAHTALTAADAHGQRHWEVGSAIGVHSFSENGELGVWDVPWASSPQSSVFLALYGSMRLLDRFAVEGELGTIPTSIRDNGAGFFALTYRLSALAHLFVGDAGFQPFVLAGVGGITGVSSDPTAIGNDADFVWHLGAGAKYRVTERWGLRLDVRILLPPSSQSLITTTDFAAFIGGYMALPGGERVARAPKDSDGDGLNDAEDKCPEKAEDVDAFQDQDGCPDLDNDEDGIPDEVDECPEAPEDKDGHEDGDGCLDPDNDGDEINDDVDKCPDAPEDKDDFEDEDGCSETDNDKDGLLDPEDSCPNEPEDKDGFEDEDGCPDPDNDKDGVLDKQDLCPHEMETVNGYEDEDGCADTIPRQIKRYTGVIKGIKFKTDSDEIRKGSFRILDAAIKILKEYPSLRLEISGHTDNTGGADYNRALSQDRADAVKKYMVDNGIAEDRLTGVGYGQDRPIANNKRRSGRAKNRRVEFKLLSDLVPQ